MKLLRRFTFGCLARPIKISDAVSRLWIALLRECPDARLLVTGPSSGVLPAGLAAVIADDPKLRASVTAIGRLPLFNYLSMYGHIDVA